jgi:hypothetical protein
MTEYKLARRCTGPWIPLKDTLHDSLAEAEVLARAWMRPDRTCAGRHGYAIIELEVEVDDQQTLDMAEILLADAERILAAA